MPTQSQPEESNQMQLLAGADMEVLAEEEHKGNFTGERLKALRPDAYREIVNSYAGGASMRSLARLYHVSVNTVSALVRSEHTLIESLKKQIGARATSVHSLAWERLEEKLGDQYQVDKTSLKDMAVVVGITGDRMALADGTPTSINETRVIAADDINGDFLDGLKRAEPVKTGFSGGVLPQKGAAPKAGAGGSGAGFAGDPADLVPGVGDSKSLVDGNACESQSGKDENDA